MNIECYSCVGLICQSKVSYGDRPSHILNPNKQYLIILQIYFDNYSSDLRELLSVKNVCST